MVKRRRRYTATYKLRIALEALKGSTRRLASYRVNTKFMPT